jgi:hypothetical protein
MSGSLTDITLANAALALLGEFAIGGFDEGSQLANACTRIIPDATKHLLTLHPWRFTMRKQRLGRRDETPINEWTYLHALPPDRLTVRAMRTAGLPGAQPLLEYEIFEDNVASHSADLWCDFQVWRDPATWPPSFTAFARNALAAELAIAVGAGPTAAELFDRKAYGSPGEQRQGGLLATARRVDSQQQPPQAIADFPLIAARRGGR